eukprot:gnl/MRDRNA2_/MRDRNA2_178076_c0_seq1.p2 gnl/MRDRNA2_/MRDRNA2_178076_c0~~gnl/MRDRNA2_/MRDRNA2_178076_c0_seq1.p2  ORF type:complete len:147 (+),score=23.96 gnl/MRDRNA2_/MRDRNA2_178076_c0_seq1:369-809(+)
MDRSSWKSWRESSSSWTGEWDSNWYWTDEGGWRWRPLLRNSRFGAMPGKKAPTAKKGPNHSKEHVRIRDLILKAETAEDLLSLSDTTLCEFELFHAVTALRHIIGFGGESVSQDSRLDRHLSALLEIVLDEAFVVDCRGISDMVWS